MADNPTYGGSERNFKIPKLKNDGAQFWTKIDNTGDTKGKITVYRRYPGPFNSAIGETNVEIGTKEKGGDFVPTNNPASGGFDTALTKDERKLFLSDDVQKQVNQQAFETTVEANKANGVTDINSRLRASELLDPDFIGTISDPNQSDEESFAKAAQQGIDTTNKSSEALINSAVAAARTKTRKGPGSFGDHSYPLDRNQSQDFMKFTLLEYKPKKVGGGASSGGFGFSDRDRVGPNGKPSGRTILGSVSLPIPGGIKDDNGCDWAGDTMNEIQIQFGALARDLTGTGDRDALGRGAENAIIGRLAANSDDVKKALKEEFAGRAVGVKNLMTRSTGMIFNPNLELLFDKPTLRGFQFSFDLIPRSQKEGEEVIKIIKFFKQGMAAIRSESNLFLLSPNVFQVHYVLNGDGNTDHPYIGKMKECAMTNFSVDYTPQANYSTLKDGFMTAYKISMQMKELEPVFNDEYGDGDAIEIGF